MLDYSQYRHFLPVIEKAMEACRNSGQRVQDHIEDLLTMVGIGSGAKRQVEDYRLSGYACYLIVQNGDPSKPVIANGQTYFAAQTRRQELADDSRFAALSEDDKRLAIRNELAVHNKHPALACAEPAEGRRGSLSPSKRPRPRWLRRAQPPFPQLSARRLRDPRGREGGHEGLPYDRGRRVRVVLRTGG